MQKIKLNFKERLTGHQAAVYALEQISEKQFLSADGNGVCILWDLGNTKQAKAVVQVPSNIFAIKYIEQLKLLCIGTFAGDLYFFDLDNKKIISKINLQCAGIYALEKYKDQLLVACGNGELLFFNLNTLLLEKTLQISNNSIRSMLFKKENELILACSDAMIYSLNLNDDTINSYEAHHKDSIFSILKLNELIISGSKDAQIKIWQHEKCLHSIPAHLFTVNDIKSNPDKTLIASASRDKSIKIWDPFTYELLKVIDPAKENSHKNSVNKLLWLEYNSYLISGSDDRSLLIYQIEK